MPTEKTGSIEKTEPTEKDRDAASPTADELGRALRRFHLRGDRGPFLARAPENVCPVLLSAMRKPDEVRHDFPLFLADGDVDVAALPVTALIDQGLDRANLTAESARVLHDNRLRLERAIRRRAHGGGLLNADMLLDAAGTALRDELALADAHDARLEEDYRALRAALPADGWFLHLDPDTALRAFIVVADHEQRARWSAFDARARELVSHLTALLAVERAKDDDHRATDAIAGSIGAGAKYVDPSAFSKTLGAWRGSQRMDPVERRRVETALGTLETHLASPERPSAVVIYEAGEPEGLPPELRVRWVRAEDPLAAATVEFDRHAASAAEVFVAARIAELEIARRYRPAQHDPWLDSFGWRRFSRDEIGLVPTVVALEGAPRLAEDRLGDYSQVLRSARPIHVFTTVAPVAHPGDPDSESRLDLGYMAIAHRTAFVHQCSVASPVSMCEGFRDALRSACPAVHVVDAGTGLGESPPLGVWLHAASALEGRAHPIFRYDPTGGETWAERFDLGGNPQPEADWPTYPTPRLGGAGDDEADAPSLAFTFADYALLEPVLADAFAVVPDAVSDAELVALSRHLAEPSDVAPSGVPFVIGVTPDGRRVRLAVTRAMAIEARARHEFWRTLQEFGGIHNAYAESAAARARAEAETTAREERTHLEREHAEALERTRTESAGRAMQGLARMLLGLDPGGIAAGSPTAPSLAGRAGASVAVPTSPAAPPGTTPAPDAAGSGDGGAAAVDDAETAPAADAADDDALVFEEAWINTPLCTSCNDCTAINPKLFVYDENKQAHIGDITAGTYAQLVQAAEKCPARCIHPGQPVNPDEPGLDELVARAAPFNQ